MDEFMGHIPGRYAGEPDYCQCQLERRTRTSLEYQTSWIPEKFAIVGKYLKLRSEDGWQVISVGSPVDPEKVGIYREAHRNIRDAVERRSYPYLSFWL